MGADHPGNGEPHVLAGHPAKGARSRHVVHVGWFEAEQDPHKLLLLSYTVGRWDLLVIPPETEPATAARMMATATDVAEPHGDRPDP